jgi:hypothetical protein
MKAAVLEKPVATSSVDSARLRDVILTRIASAGAGATKGELVLDLAPMVAHRLSAARLREIIDSETGALLKAGLAIMQGPKLAASAAGAVQAGKFLGMRGALLHPWSEVRDARLIAKALGLQREPAKRLNALSTRDGLHSAIVQRAYNLKINGTATPSRLRAALARVALERAFGNRIGSGLTGKSGLSAKAGRLLAAQLSRKPRDFGTDGRLIAALAAEHVGASQANLASLRLAILRRFVEGPTHPSPARKPRPAKRTPALLQPVAVEPAPIAPPLQSSRPDLAGFCYEVRRHAAARAQGWVGDRKAYISHVWRALSEQRPEWTLSEIEFKCMLAEAHRAGQLALANADLKDNDSIKDLQESAIVYKNAVFHFIRVES